MPCLGEIAALTTSVSWTFTAMFFSAASQRVGSFQVNLLRIPLALILLFSSYLLLFGDFTATRFQIWMLALSGVIGLAAGDSFLFEAFVHLGARLALLVFSLSPAMAAIIAFLFLHESVSFIAAAGIGVTISGVFLVLLEKKSDHQNHAQTISIPGVVFALFAALGQAIGLVIAKSALQMEINPLLATVIRMAAATLFIWPAAVLMGKIQNPVKLFRDKGRAVLFLLGGTFFGPFLGVWLSMVAIKHTNTGVAATLMSLMPVFIIPLEMKIHGTRFSFRAISGTVLTVSGVAILFLR